jgi:hypothetical protein
MPFGMRQKVQDGMFELLKEVLGLEKKKRLMEKLLLKQQRPFARQKTPLLQLSEVTGTSFL